MCIKMELFSVLLNSIAVAIGDASLLSPIVNLQNTGSLL